MTELRTSPPPPRAIEVRRWLLTGTTELRDLRASLHRAITGLALGDDEALDEIPEKVALVATELATNAIRHGGPPTTVRLLQAEDFLVLEVADQDLTTAPELPDAPSLGEGGRGLLLAEQFSLEVGWYATDSEKHIWATFPTPAGFQCDPGLTDV